MTTGTQIAYYHTCHRKLWLFANGINMEQTSETVAEGKLIGDTSYSQRAEKYTELDIEGSKIDFYDAKNKVVHEVKKSDKVENAHIAQVKYYLWLLKKSGVYGATGIIEYPKLKNTETVALEEGDELAIETWISEVKSIIDNENCPPLLNKPICKKCSYYDLCYCE